MNFLNQVGSFLGNFGNNVLDNMKNGQPMLHGMFGGGQQGQQQNMFNMENPLEALKNFFGMGQQGQQNSEQQLQQAQAQQQQTTPEAEAAARQAGFPSAAAMSAWMMQRRNKVGGTTGAKAPMSFGTALAAHPANTIGRAASAVEDANRNF